MTVRRRHVPERSCVICGKKTSKRELLRIVATPQGAVTVDKSGKLPGRGAYVCIGGECAPDRLKRGRLEHALRASISDENWNSLLSSLRELKISETP
ncbi:MAG: YlxR family protein [Chloroflexi bacterium]|nr:YlxR family protein [Chloroflexota bacterium]